MKNLLYAAALVMALISCTKEDDLPLGFKTGMTVQEAIAVWEADATAHGVEIYPDIVVQFIPMDEVFNGFAFGNTIQINSNTWRGSIGNLNTVYHELGHVYKLGHDVTLIMNAKPSRETIMKSPEEYWALIIKKSQQ